MGDYIDEDLNLEVVTAKAVEFISDDYGSNEVVSEENETNLSSADSDDGNEESEFPVHEEKEEREPSEVELSSVVRSKDEGKRMIENLVRKLKQMNKFLAGLIEYWDNEAAMSGSEMERSAYEHGEDGKDTEEKGDTAPTSIEVDVETESAVTDLPVEEDDDDDEVPVELESTVQRRLRRRRRF